MTTPTLTRPTPTAPAVPTVASIPSVDDLRAALAVVNSGDARGEAGATLKSITLARYAHHATAAARATSDEGSRFIDSDTRKAIALAMWHEAGHGTTPASDSRTPGDKSLAQYVARFGTVASSMGAGYGVGALANVKSADKAYKAISEASGRNKADKASRALLAWESSLSQAEARAMRTVFDLLTTHGKDHAPAWARKVAAQNKATSGK